MADLTNYSAEELNRASKEAKREDIKNNLNFDVPENADDQTIDLLYGLAHMDESSVEKCIEDVTDCMDALGASEEDLVEALHVHGGFTISEAREIVADRLREKERHNTKTDRLISLL